MNIADINKIYNKFGPNPNMGRIEFIREMQDLTDPGKMQNDLMEIELHKARQRSNQIRIDQEWKIEKG